MTLMEEKARLRMKKHFTEAKVRKLNQSIQVDERLLTAQPELDPPCIIAGLLTIEAQDFQDFGVGKYDYYRPLETADTLVLRLLFSLWGKERVERVLDQIKARDDLNVTMPDYQLGRLAALLPDSYLP